MQVLPGIKKTTRETIDMYADRINLFRAWRSKVLDFPDKYKICMHQSHLGTTHSLQSLLDDKWFIVAALPYWSSSKGETWISRSELII